MKAALIQILMGAIGTLGFSIYFRVSERNVAAATFGGAMCLPPMWWPLQWCTSGP